MVYNSGIVNPKVPVVMIWLDNIAGDLFMSMYERGELQSTYEYFSKGKVVEKAITVFPTVSEAAEGAVISGLFAGETNMVGERYFYRKTGVVHHYKFNARVDDDFAAPRSLTLDALASSSYGFGRLLKRGGVIVDSSAVKACERSGSVEVVDMCIDLAISIAREKRPNLLFFSISADYISHVSGRTGAAVSEFLRRFDEELPRLLRELDKLYGKYSLFVFSDHGSKDVNRHFDIAKFLEESGFLPYRASLLEHQADRNCAALSNGRGMGLVYFRHPSLGWATRPDYKLLRRYPLGGGSVDIPALLAEEDAVDFVAVKKSENTVAVISRDGEGEIAYSEAKNAYRYRVIRGADPLGYEVSDEWRSEEEWLKLTYDSEHPDGVVQLYNLFKAENCGDVVLNSAPSWDFWELWDIPYPVLKSSHGGLSRDEMVTFVLARGPGISPGHLSYARLLDIYATIARYYGVQDCTGRTHAVDRLTGS